jgi:DNA-binding NarL/FixJ family response regulator
MPIRIVLAEDHYLVREGLRRLLDAQPELDVAGVCGDYDALLKMVDERQPAVVVTDIRMPPSHSDEGIRAAESLRVTHPDVGVVVLSQYANAGYALKLLDEGSSGRAYLLKERVQDVGQLVNAIRAVAAGGSVIDAKVVEGLVAERARGATSPLGQLTGREREVLRRMAEGHNNAAIASELGVTERSVEKVVHSILLKLGLTWEPAVHKRVKAVIMYLAESDRSQPVSASQPATTEPVSPAGGLVRRPPSASTRSRMRSRRSAS